MAPLGQPARMWKSLTKWKLLTTWWPGSTQPQDSWSLRSDMLTPLIPPCYLTISQDNCVQADHRIYDSSPSPGFLKCFAENLQGFAIFLGHEPPISLLGSAINIFLLQTLTFHFVRPHCAQGTWICANSITLSWGWGSCRIRS